MGPSKAFKTERRKRKVGVEARGDRGEGRQRQREAEARRGFFLLLAFLEGCWFFLLFSSLAIGAGGDAGVSDGFCSCLFFVCCGGVKDLSCFGWFCQGCLG